MKFVANSVETYIEQLPEERKIPIQNIRHVISKNIPCGFDEGILYNMIGWYVPITAYKDGYNGNRSSPLPFINLASQKNFIALYHMGIYANEEMLDWFVDQLNKQCKRKSDIGKSCIRFKYMDDIPYALIGELCKRISVDAWIQLYEKNVKT